ncbi:MAG: hypothetical protein ACKO7N_00975, partial [Candidatus Nitrosotenuis sp.]
MNFDKFINASSLKTKIIANDEDLTETFKNALDITFQTLVPLGVPICSNKISPISFNLTTNEFLGTINYSVTYDTKRTMANETEDTIIYKTSIDVESPNRVYAEFPIPNGNYIIQDLDTFTSKKIKVTVNARRKPKDCCPN